MKKISANLNAAGKRMAIAKDILNKLNECEFIVSNEYYLETANKFFDKDDCSLDISLREAFDSVDYQADAFGSIFVSIINLFKDMPCSISIIDDAREIDYCDNFVFKTIEPIIQEFFSDEQIRLIDLAFDENRSQFEAVTDREKCGAVMYQNCELCGFNEYECSCHEEDKGAARLRSIMENIVDHRGEFVVEVNQELLAEYNTSIILRNDDNEDEQETTEYCELCGYEEDNCGCHDEEEETCSTCGILGCSGCEDEEETCDDCGLEVSDCECVFCDSCGINEFSCECEEEEEEEEERCDLCYAQLCSGECEEDENDVAEEEDEEDEDCGCEGCWCEEE